MRLSELEAVVESLLFIAGDAVPLASIAQTIELDQATTRAVELSLADKYEKEKRGLRIVEIADACVRRRNALNISAICIKAHSGRD